MHSHLASQRSDSCQSAAPWADFMQMALASQSSRRPSQLIHRLAAICIVLQQQQQHHAVATMVKSVKGRTANRCERLNFVAGGQLRLASEHICRWPRRQLDARRRRAIVAVVVIVVGLAARNWHSQPSARRPKCEGHKSGKNCARLDAYFESNSSQSIPHHLHSIFSSINGLFHVLSLSTRRDRFSAIPKYHYNGDKRVNDFRT